MANHQYIRRYFLTLVLAVAVMASGWACNLSSMTYCGITPGGTLVPGYPLDSTICINLCVGYGRTGLVTGADNDTRTFSFSFYSSLPMLNLRGFFPPAASSPPGVGAGVCSNPGLSLGAQGAPFNCDQLVMYVDPGYYGSFPCVTRPYACITSTAICGNVAQQCTTYYFQFNRVPDSVRVFGVEGGGNPVAGCTWDTDMGSPLRLGAPLSNALSGLTGAQTARTIQLDWSTSTETNLDFFVVERADEYGDFEAIGQVRAAGNSTQAEHYRYVDMAPSSGSNRYRLLLLDQEGNSSYSQVVTVRFGAPNGFEWGAIGPNPTRDRVEMTFYTDRSETLTLNLYDVQGKVVMSKAIVSQVGANEIDLNLLEVQTGAYFVALNGGDRKLLHRIVRVDCAP